MSCSEHKDCRGEGYHEHIEAWLDSTSSQELYDEINSCCGTTTSELKSCLCWKKYKVLNSEERIKKYRKVWILRDPNPNFGPNPFKMGD